MDVNENPWARTEATPAALLARAYALICHAEEATDDLVQEHLAGPSALDRSGGVPVPLVLVIEPVQQDGDVAPRQLANSVLANWCRPRGGGLTHVLQV